MGRGPGWLQLGAVPACDLDPCPSPCPNRPACHEETFSAILRLPELLQLDRLSGDAAELTYRASRMDTEWESGVATFGLTRRPRGWTLDDAVPDGDGTVRLDLPDPPDAECEAARWTRTTVSLPPYLPIVTESRGTDTLCLWDPDNWGTLVSR